MRPTGASTSAIASITPAAMSRPPQTMICAPPLTWTEAEFQEAEKVIGKALDLTLNDVRGELAA